MTSTNQPAQIRQEDVNFSFGATEKASGSRFGYRCV